MVLASMVKPPARTKTLPPLKGPLGVLADRVERAVMATGAKLVTVKPDVLRGSTGTSPRPATLVTWIVPAGALRVPPVMVTGPATSPRFAGTDPGVADPGASVLR